MPSAGGIRAGKAFVELGVRDKATPAIRMIGAKMGRLGDRIFAIGRNVTAASAAMAAPFVAGFANFARFDAVMRRVEAKSRGTAEQMKALRDQAERLGDTTSFTATQIGQLQMKLAQLGFNRGQILQMTEDIRNLAVAAGSGRPDVDAALSAELVGSVLNQFRMEADQTQRVADALTETTNNSAFALEGLKQALAESGSMAAEMNLSLEETLAILGAMRSAGLQPSRTGTALKNMLLFPVDARRTEKFNRMLEETTGRTIRFADAAGNMRSPIELMDEIGRAVEGLGTRQTGGLLKELFGMESIAGANAARRSLDTVRELKRLLDEAGGAAERAAQKMESGPQGALNRIRSAIDGIFRKLGEATGATKTLDQIAVVLSTIAHWLGENREKAQQVFHAVLQIGAAGIGLMVLGGSLMVISQALMGLASVTTIISGLAATLTAIGPALAGIAATVGGVSLAAWFLGGSEAAQDMFREIKEGASEAGSTFQRNIDAIIQALRSGQIERAWEMITLSMQKMWMEMVDGLMDGLEKLYDGLKFLPVPSAPELLNRAMGDPYGRSRDLYRMEIDRLGDELLILRRQVEREAARRQEEADREKDSSSKPDVSPTDPAAKGGRNVVPDYQRFEEPSPMIGGFRGVEKGTIEAAMRAIQNRNNEIEQKQLGEQQEGNELAREMLREMRQNQIRVIG
jgi:TP901 family phage tail tape measure protein